MNKITPIEGWLNTPNLRMHYQDWATPGPRQGQESDNQADRTDNVVLALHGLASSCHWYDLVIPHLVDTYRFIAPDQRGHGQTDQPSTGYDWQSVATDAIHVLDHFGVEKAAVIGHSWGANVALSVAAKYPERVSALVLVDGGFFDWTLSPGATWESFRERLRPRDVSGTKEEWLTRLSQQLADCWNEQLQQIVLTMVRVDEEGMIRDILEPGNHAQVLEAMWFESPSTMFHLVRCPTLIMAAAPRQGARVSEFSRMRLDMAEMAKDAIKGCQVEWIADTSHDIGYHQPAEMARVVRAFLSEI